MVNNIVLVGRITKDPEIRQINNDSAVCNFTLAVNRNFKNAQGDYDTDFINCVVFNQVANLMEQYVFKGQLLGIQGRIQTRNYENEDGKRVYITEVVANNVSFLENQNNINIENTQNNSQNDDFNDDLNIDDDDLPF